MSDFEKEKQAFELYLKEVQSTVKEDAFCTWADKPDRSFQPSFWDLAQSFYGGYHSRDEEIAHLRAEIERKDELLRKIKIEADRIQNIDYGWDGDCGAKNHAEFIEYLAEQALQNKE